MDTSLANVILTGTGNPGFKYPQGILKKAQQHGEHLKALAEEVSTACQRPPSKDSTKSFIA